MPTNVPHESLYQVYKKCDKSVSFGKIGLYFCDSFGHYTLNGNLRDFWVSFYRFDNWRSNLETTCMQ